MSHTTLCIKLRKHGVLSWHYVQVSKVKAPLLMQASTSTAIDLNDYGTVLESGWGSEPPHTIQSKYSSL